MKIEIEKPPILLNNNDAFKIMEYRCDKCGASEFIWNSRNNVSPFTVGCQTCEGGTMMHVNFRGDQFRPGFKPAKGMRYFCDFTKERALEVAKKHVAAFLSFAEKNPKMYSEMIEKCTPGTDKYEEHILELCTNYMTGACSMDLRRVE